MFYGLVYFSYFFYYYQLMKMELWNFESLLAFLMDWNVEELMEAKLEQVQLNFDSNPIAIAVAVVIIA